MLIFSVSISTQTWTELTYYCLGPAILSVVVIYFAKRAQSFEKACSSVKELPTMELVIADIHALFVLATIFLLQRMWQEIHPDDNPWIEWILFFRRGQEQAAIPVGIIVIVMWLVVEYGKRTWERSQHGSVENGKVSIAVALANDGKIESGQNCLDVDAKVGLICQECSVPLIFDPPPSYAVVVTENENTR